MWQAFLSVLTKTLIYFLTYCFYRVLYFSTHRYENGNYWPNLEESNYNWIGSGAGMGYNCNIPLNKTGMGNTEFLTIWHQILLPMAYKVNRNPTSVAVSNSTVEFNSVIKYQLVLIFHFQFNPDLVIVSAGFDAALGCPEVIKNESS